jgi:hypothetical protein
MMDEWRPSDSKVIMFFRDENHCCNAHDGIDHKGQWLMNKLRAQKTQRQPTKQPGMNLRDFGTKAFAPGRCLSSTPERRGALSVMLNGSRCYISAMLKAKHSPHYTACAQMCRVVCLRIIEMME